MRCEMHLLARDSLFASLACLKQKNTSHLSYNKQNMTTDKKDDYSPPAQRRSVRFATPFNGGAADDDISELGAVTDSLRQSAGSSASSTKSPNSLGGGESLRSNLMRQQKNRDPLFYYEVLNIVGCGSMGSVARVRKRDEVIGGSARSSIVDSFNKKKKRDECFSIPVFGSLFQFCVKLGEEYSEGSDVSKSTRSTASATAASTGSEMLVVPSDDGSATSSKRGADIVYAMKSIHLSRVKDEAFVQELANEIEILKKLDHPHIVRPIETFHFRNQIFVVMELCRGGDLYSRDPYTEDQAARIVSSILSAVAYMHDHNITHRDLKYENVLFVNETPQSEIKLIDFGLSKKYVGGEKLTDGVGTIYTMAPEVLLGSYSQSADLWSIGVIAFMLLSSRMPFYGRKRREVMEKIMACEYDFKGRRWKSVSQQAKDFVADLIVTEADDRPTAAEALSHVWLNRRYGATVRAPTVEEASESYKSIKAFAGYSKLKKLSLMVIAHKSTSEEIGILRKLFQEYDVDRNGVLSFEEFKAAMQSQGYSDDELEDMFHAVDLDGTGKIRYTEFLAATIEAQGAISEERLAEAFDRLDSDDSGYIDADNLIEILGNEIPAEEIRAIIDEADITRDNRISYSEFLALWEQKHEEKREHLMVEISKELQSPTVSTHPVDDAMSSVSTSHRDENDIEDANTDAVDRANFIDSKLHSERKWVTMDSDDALLNAVAV